jgi:hypothetical protein
MNFNEISEKKNCLGQNLLLLEAKNSFRVERVKVVKPSIKMITMENAHKVTSFVILAKVEITISCARKLTIM